MQNSLNRGREDGSQSLFQVTYDMSGLVIVLVVGPASVAAAQKTKRASELEPT